MESPGITISFVIPAYNASKTIIRCLDSIYSLPLEEDVFEVVAIDDCSTDDTVELITGYARNHRNLVLLCQQENMRQGAARNRGLSVAQGGLIAFVDSDDMVGGGIVEAIKIAGDGQYDMVAVRYKKVTVNMDVISEMALPYKDEVFDGIKLQTEYPFWGTAPWAYIYRKHFLNEVNYPFAEGVLYEDSDFVNVHLYHAGRMSYCDECGYLYIYNSASTTNTVSPGSLCDYALLGTRMLAFYESLPEKTTRYAGLILEGGSYNVKEACRKLMMLKSKRNVKSFYDRFDSHYDRASLLKYTKPEYCWNWWTRFCLRHKRCATVIIGTFGIFFIRHRVSGF